MELENLTLYKSYMIDLNELKYKLDLTTRCDCLTLNTDIQMGIILWILI